MAFIGISFMYRKSNKDHIVFSSAPKSHCRGPCSGTEGGELTISFLFVAGLKARMVRTLLWSL